MITVFDEGRGFRVVWLLEEMGLPYRLRPVECAKVLARALRCHPAALVFPGWEVPVESAA